MARAFTASDPSLVASRIILSATVKDVAGHASRDTIRRLFYSPLGVYVSQASREQDSLHLEFDVASEDLDFTIRTLQNVLPGATVEAIRPRVFTHGH